MLPEPVPQILITCQKVRLPNGQYRLDPQVELSHMPRAWDGAYVVLQDALEKVVEHRLTLAREQGMQRVQVVPQMPGGLVKQ